MEPSVSMSVPQPLRVVGALLDSSSAEPHRKGLPVVIVVIPVLKVIANDVHC